MRHFLLLTLCLFCSSLWASTFVNFEDQNLAELDALGIHFTPNIAITPLAGSVFDDPNNGSASAPNSICVGNCGGQIGSVTFDFDINFFSIIALSGPGADNLTAGMRIEAFDISGTKVAEDFVNTSVQFDLLSVEADNIRRVDLISLFSGSDAWDDLTFQVQEASVPEVNSIVLMIMGGLGLFLQRKK